MGVASVGLVYDLVRRRFGRAAGFVGRPRARADADHRRDLAPQQPGRAARAVLRRRAVGARARARGRPHALARARRRVRRPRLRDEDGARRCWSCPGIVAAWLWVAPRGRRRRAAAAARRRRRDGRRRRCAWPVLMWLTPAADRPWISGTDDNSIWSLILGYNGLGRLDGQAGGPRRRPAAAGGGGVFGGAAGPAAPAQRGARRPGRLAARLRARRRRRARGREPAAPHRRPHGLADRRRRRVRRPPPSPSACAKGIFHPYYVSLLAPFTAALVGAGAGLCCGDRVARRGPLAIAGGVATELVVIANAAADLDWATRPDRRRRASPRSRSRSHRRAASATAARDRGAWPRCCSRRPPGRCRRSATRRAGRSRPAARPRTRWAAGGRGGGGRRRPGRRPPRRQRPAGAARSAAAPAVQAARPPGGRRRPGRPAAAACSAATRPR